MKYCDIIIWQFHHKIFHEKILLIEEYDNWKTSTPLIWKRKFKIRHRSTPRYKMPFWYLIQVKQTQLYAKGFVVPMGGTLVYRTFSNYIELWTKYHLLSIFSIKVVVIQQKVSCFQIVSIMYWQYILILISMWRLHLSSLYVGHICIIKRPRSFWYPEGGIAVYSMADYKRVFFSHTFRVSKVTNYFRFHLAKLVLLKLKK